MRGTPSIGTSTFLRYNMKFRGKHYTTVHKIVRVVLYHAFPAIQYISCSIVESRFPVGQCIPC